MSASPVIAVTGATGFLGRHVVTALAPSGARLRLLVRREPSDAGWDAPAPELVRGALEDAAALERLVRGADAVVHVAGLITARDRGAFLRVNRDGAHAIAAAARRLAPTARFVLVSSLAAREPRLSDYAASKRAGEEAVRAVYRDAAERLVILRPPVIYGPGDRATLTIFKAASHAVVPIAGSGRIAVVHAADAAGAIARVALGAGPAGAYALADENPAGYSLRELVAEAARAVGRTARCVRIPDRAVLLAGHAASWQGRWRREPPRFNAGKAREVLHPDWSVAADELLPAAIYRSRIGLAAGFRETVAWYQRARWLD